MVIKAACVETWGRHRADGRDRDRNRRGAGAVVTDVLEWRGPLSYRWWMLSCRGHGWDHRVDGGDAHCRRCRAGGGALCHRRRRRMRVVAASCVVYKHAD